MYARDAMYEYFLVTISIVTFIFSSSCMDNEQACYKKLEALKSPRDSLVSYLPGTGEVGLEKTLYSQLIKP